MELTYTGYAIKLMSGYTVSLEELANKLIGQISAYGTIV